MNRQQILKFWKALDDSTNQGKTISSFKNKPGYDTEATLRRYAKVQTCFKDNDLLEEICKKTNWRIKSIKQLHGWWEAEFKTVKNDEESDVDVLLKKRRKQEVGEDVLGQQLIQKWRVQMQLGSPVQLLQRELESASRRAINDYFANEDEKETTSKAYQRHYTEIKLHLQSDPAYISLGHRFPQSAILTKLNESLDVWEECFPKYYDAFTDLMRRVQTWAKLVMDSLNSGAAVSNANLSTDITEYRKQHAYAVLVACDLLKCGLSEFPSNALWLFLIIELDDLRMKLNLELSALTKKTRNGGWPSNVKLLWADPQDSSRMVQKTRAYLNELVKLQAAQNSLETILGELEGKLKG